MGTNSMTDKYTDPDVRESIEVTMPEAGVVYYDTVLDTVATVHEVSNDFVTYVIEQEVDNIHSDPREKFLAWLAAERFVKLGERDEKGTLTTTKDEIERVFEQKYHTNLTDQGVLQVAVTVVEDVVDEKIEVTP